ncbi:pyrroline-5-carboxylate reductase [Deefgea piscis]|uniref:pyrroline-5-carboxylate reductase n=1 Tax=Deefgea piscis TaxID=2739061 RepID=UPI001C805F24|nr:pyrroline-5-carboxylate reductase [Deefgea piscis]QZA81926.1 pyrroline-5-carboxylate reductase [Deefgea piscis]
MKITYIGGGNMASAMIGGMLSQGFKGQDIHVVEPDAGKRVELAQQYGISCSAPDEALPASQAIIFAIKPQQFRTVAQSILPQLNHALVISIAAGIRAATISQWLAGYQRIVRVMPNTPALVQAGISGVYATEHVTDTDKALTTRILASIGEQVWVNDESQMDGITAISGSGPAYVFYLMEALQAAALAQGFDAEIANKLAYQTFAGAVKLALTSPDDAGTLQVKVTSKGGTTERAIQTLEAHHVRATMIAAAAAAAARSVELGDELSQDPK